MQATINHREQGTFVIEGELNMQTVPTISEKLPVVISAITEKTITFDLSSVSRSDSAGVALLVEIMQLARLADLNLSFSNLPQQMQDIAGVSGLLDILPISHS